MPKTATNGTGAQIRTANASDLSAVVSLAKLYDISIIGEPDVDESDFADAWKNPRTRLADDVWVAVGPKGKLVGYEHCVDPAGNGRVEIEGFVHPDWQGRGIGTILLDRAVRRAQEVAARLPTNARRFVRAGTFVNDHAARDLMDSAGLTRVRHFLRMTIQLAHAPTKTAPPGGIRIAPLAPGESFEAVHGACDQIFKDHWGNTPVAYDAWVTLRTGGERFDRSLWFIARTPEGELAGISLCSNYPDMGWVDTLGVRRPYRGLGLAKALLQHSFVELFGRNQQRIGLGVDAESLTGAAKLYESVGMRADVTASVWELELE